MTSPRASANGTFCSNHFYRRACSELLSAPQVLRGRLRCGARPLQLGAARCAEPVGRRDAVRRGADPVSAHLSQRLAREDYVSCLLISPPPECRQLEYNDAGEVIPNRTEALVDYHQPASEFLREGPLPQFVSKLIGHKTALYKDKLNYKATFGGGGCERARTHTLAFPDLYLVQRLFASTTAENPSRARFLTATARRPDTQIGRTRTCTTWTGSVSTEPWKTRPHSSRTRSSTSA